MSSPHYNTGHAFEYELIYGGISVPPCKVGKIPYVPFKQAIIECITSHPGYAKKHLSDPPSRWMNDVLYTVAENLHVEMRDVQIFPTRGLAADFYHGIDFFILYTDPNTDEQTIVTVDISLQSIKSEEGYKADLIVSDTGASANPEYYPDIKSFDLPDVKGASASEDAATKKLHRINTAQIVAAIMKEKMSSGDMHYGSLYSHKNIHCFRDEVRDALGSVLESAA